MNSLPQDRTPLPLEVERAYARAQTHGFDRSSSPGMGRLLRILAAMRPGGRFAELGTGHGVGTAWLLSGMDSTSSLVTVELDPARAAINRVTLTDPRITTLEGDWPMALQPRLFDLIFSDAASAKQETTGLPAMLEALRSGGCIVMDNFSPLESLPAHLNGVDPIREAIWEREDVIPLEIAVSKMECAIMIVKRG